MFHFINQIFSLCVISCFFVGYVSANKLTVAVASNFSPILESLASDFEALYEGVELIVISGSSGKIYAQIIHGAPFDAFMSADQDKPLRLVEEGLAAPETRFTYAVGELVLWSAAPELIINEGTLRALAYNKLALANSKLAPYGLAAEEVLDRLGVLMSSRAKWVQGENISQTYQFVSSGNAELGFVSKSQVWKNGYLLSGSVWLIPSELYSPIKQDAVILKNTKNRQLAEKFMQFLKTPLVRNKIEMYGYQTDALNINHH